MGSFDNIDHEMLMDLLKRRVSDRRVLKLIWQWLKAGVLENGGWSASEMGSPQGGVISPLLANIYLHVLDMYWVEQYASLGTLVRYADDFVIICRTRRDAEEALQKVKLIMTKLKLTLHPSKTRSVDMGREGFDFLGFHFHKMKSRKTSKLLPYSWPGQKAMKSVRKKLHDITARKSLDKRPQEIIASLNPVIRGWRNYFRCGNSTQKLKQLDIYLWLRLRRWSRLLVGSRGHWNKSVFEKWIARCGLENFYRSGICVSP